MVYRCNSVTLLPGVYQITCRVCQFTPQWNFCYGENQSRKPIRERSMYSNWTKEECETAILKEKTCHKYLEVSVVI